MFSSGKGVNTYTTTNFPPILLFQRFKNIEASRIFVCLYFLHTEIQLPYVLQIFFKYNNHVAYDTR